MVPVVVRVTLSGKQELITCNTFSMRYSDLSTASQSSTGAHAERTLATGYHISYGDHWFPPSIGA